MTSMKVLYYRERIGVCTVQYMINEYRMESNSMRYRE